MAIDATARVADGARIGHGVEIGPYCVVGPHVELKDGVRADPLVQAVLSRFPGAEIVDVRAAADASGGAPEELPFVSEDSGDPADEER